MTASFSLRPARAEDELLIKRLIKKNKLNPFNLKWRHFTVAVDDTGRFVGCVQCKRHRGDVRELASLAVVDQWQGRGVGRALIDHILATNPSPIWLVCGSPLVRFYQRAGFIEHDELHQLPIHFRRLARLARVFRFFVRRKIYLAVMSHSIT